MNQTSKVLIVGDIVCSYQQEGSYLPYLEKIVDSTNFVFVKPTGAEGCLDINNLLNHLPDWLADQPDVIILHIGFAETIGKRRGLVIPSSLEDCKNQFENIRKILSASLTRKVILILPHPLMSDLSEQEPVDSSINQDIATFNDWAKRTAKYYKIDAIDCYKKFHQWGLDQSLVANNFGITEKAAKRIANVILKALDKWRTEDQASPETPYDRELDYQNSQLSDFFTRYGRLGLQAISKQTNLDILEISDIVYRSEHRDAINIFRPHMLSPWTLDIVKSELVDNLAYIKLQSGRVFYGYSTGQMMLNLYELLKQFLPDIVHPACFRLAIDVSNRYQQAIKQCPTSLLSSLKGGTIFEVGAYLGFKSIRFAEFVENNGKVVSIEVLPENFEIMDKNVNENSLNHTVKCVNKGVWNQSGFIGLKGIGRQANTLVDIEQKQKYKPICEVATDTLANIMDDYSIDVVDFMNLQVMGAEIEALEGLRDRLNSVKILRIVCPFSREGNRTYEICRQMLTEAGSLLLKQSNENVIYAVTRNFSHEFKADLL